MNRVAIIGGGITGLALGCELARRRMQVTVYEKDEKTGGLAAAHGADHFTFDKFYRHIFAGHDELLSTIRDLGLQDRLVFKKASMAYFANGEIYPLNSARDLLRFAPLRPLDRLRVGIGASAMLLQRGWQAFDGVSAEAFLEKKCGARAFRTFWEPLLKNKFGDRSSCVSATWFWDRLQSRARRRLARSVETLGYLQGGFEPLFRRMEAEIASRHGRVLTRHPVEVIERKPGECGSFSVNGDRLQAFDACIVTLPAPLFMEACPALPAEYRQRLASINYSHSICVVMRLREPLSPHYWINIGDPGFPFAVVVEHTNWMGCADYGGQHLVYLSRYVNHCGDGIWNAADSSVAEQYCVFMKKIFRNFHESQILGFHVFRERYTQPIFHTHYSRALPDFATPLKNLFLVNTSQFYPHSRCMNTSFQLARKFASQWRAGETEA